MAKTKLGEFVVKTHGNDKKLDEALIIIKRNIIDDTEINKFKDSIDKFIGDLGKFETLVNGALPFLNIAIAGLISKKQTYPLTHLDFEEHDDFNWQRKSDEHETIFSLTLEAKEDKITKQKKDLSPGQIDLMIRNIEKYHSMKETLKLFKGELLTLLK